MDKAVALAREMITEIDQLLSSGQTSFNEDGGLYAQKRKLEEFLRRLENKES